MKRRLKVARRIGLLRRFLLAKSVRVILMAVYHSEAMFMVFDGTAHRLFKYLYRLIKLLY